MAVLASSSLSQLNSGALHAFAGSSASPIHVATVNIRYDGNWRDPVPIPQTGVINPPDNSGNPYREWPWAVRRSRLVDAVLSTGDLDIIGFQEVLHNQLLDLDELLGPNWNFVGVGRDDGKEAGEYSPIFYDQSRFEQLNYKTIWLSDKPDQVGSIGWDAGQTRIATLLSLKDGDKNTVHVVNTHYDDRGVNARAQSSLLIRQAIRDFVNESESKGASKNGPVILFGDFNSPPEEDGYKNIVSQSPLPNKQDSFSFLDTFTHLVTRVKGKKSAQSAPYGPKNTYTGFSAPGQNNDVKRIDFIMLGADVGSNDARGGWYASQFAVIDNWVEGGDSFGWQGRWSDHRAVRATISK